MLNRMAERETRARDRLIGRAVDLAKSPNAPPVALAGRDTIPAVSTGDDTGIYTTDEDGFTVTDFTLGLDELGGEARLRVEGRLFDYGT